MNWFGKQSMKWFEISIKADEKIIEIAQEGYDKTGKEKYLKKIQRAKDSIENTKKKMEKYK